MKIRRKVSAEESAFRKVAAGWHLKLSTLRALGYDTLSSDETRRLVRIPGSSSSIALEYDDLDGKPTGIVRVRYTDPTSAKDGRKYTGKVADPVALFLTRGLRSKWRRIARKTSIPLVFTEGEAEAIYAATQCNLPVIAIQGHSSWQSGGVPAEQFGQFKWKRRRVIVVPDSDYLTNAEVRRGFGRLCDYLQSLGADVHVRLMATQPENFDPKKPQKSKTGLGDYLHYRGREAFDALPTIPASDPYIKSWHAADTSLPEVLNNATPIDDAWLRDALPPLEYTWRGYLPRFCVGLLIAEGGIGKTQLALDLALNVATGGKLFGLPCRQGKVMFLAMEDPPDILRRRLHTLYKRYTGNMRPAQRKQFREDIKRNLVLVSLVGSQFHLIELNRGAVKQSASLDSFIALLKQSGPYELVVLDPMSRLHGMDENANAIGTALMNSGERVAREAWTTVLIAHHTGKASATSKREDAYSARGASGLADAARVVLRLRELGAEESAKLSGIDPNTQVIKLVHAKCNYAPKYKDTYLRRSSGGTLRKINVEFKNSNVFEDWIARLSGWFVAQKHKPFTRKEVTEGKRHDVSGDSTSRDKAREFFVRAAKDGLLTRTGQTRNRGDLFVLAKGAAHEA